MGLFSVFRRTKNETIGRATKLHFVECGPACGFRVQSHNRSELVPMVQIHLKNAHKTSVTDAEADAAIKTA